MKKIIILLGLIIGMGLVITCKAQVNLHFNLGLQPAWGPTGYDYVDYYLTADIDS